MCIYVYMYICIWSTPRRSAELPKRPVARRKPTQSTTNKTEIDALGVITISHGCFERCCSNKTPPHTILTSVS